MELPGLLPLFTFQAFLLFARLGAAIFVFPALSDISIPARVRLLIAVTATLVLLPLLQSQLPMLPTQTGSLVGLLGIELIIGLLLGLAARLMMAALSVAGEMIAFMAGFQGATLFDPQSGASTAAPTLLLTLTAGVLILALNLHHQLIHAVVASYNALPAGQLPPVPDVTAAIIQLFGIFTVLGIQLAAPVVIAGFLVTLAFGVFNRLIPQIQVYFLTVPLSITLSLVVLMAAFTGLFGLFAKQLQANLILFELAGEQP